MACGGSPELAPATPPAAGERVLHDLVETFAAADVELEVARIDFGSPAARPHLLHGWGRDEQDDARTFAWGLGESSAVEIDVVEPRPLRLVLHGRAFDFEGAPAQTVAVAFNGQSLGTIELGPSFTRPSLAVPAEAVVRGRNVVELRYGYHRQPAEVFDDSNDRRPLAALWYSLALEGLRDAGWPELTEATAVLPVGSGLLFHQPVSGGDTLVLDAVTLQRGALVLEAQWPNGRMIQQRVDDATTELRWPLEPPALESPAVETAESETSGPETSTGAGGIVRIALRAVAAESSWRDWLPMGGAPRVELLRPRIEGPDLASDVTTVPRQGEAPRPDVIVYLIDTLRADHLGLYGYDRPTSPELDSFGDDATVFLDAQAQTSWTRTAVISLFTGLLPQVHGVNQRDQALVPEVETLAELLGATGYETLGFYTNGNVDAAFGLDQGFDHYQYLRESRERRTFHQLADTLNAWAFKWLDGLEPRSERQPFLLYLHATDPHAPYTPPDEFYERFAAGVDREQGWIETVHAISAGRREAPPGTAEAWRDLYDGEIAFVDHEFGRLLDRLRQLDLYDSSLIVVLSDHGEEFGEHGGWEHGKTLYGEQLRVPLLIKLPKGAGAGRRVTARANQIDVLPTILDYLRIASPVLDGRSLLPEILGRRGEGYEPPPSFAYLRLGERRARSVVEHGFKLIVDDTATRPALARQLFDVASDPNETHEAATEHPLPLGYLGQQLTWLDLDLARRDHGVEASEATLEDALRERLEALGYVGN